MTVDNVKKLKVYAVAFASVLGSIYGGLEAYKGIRKSMDETAKKKLESYTLPIVKTEIRKTVDSIFTSRKVSFREQLAKELNLTKEEIPTFLASWYLQEQAIKSIGLFKDIKQEELYYIHTDLKRYRPFLDESGYYYFINKDNDTEWCK
jgi:hypothetical protein